MNHSASIDYLVVGHICRDVTPDGFVAGGTVTYSGRTALALGARPVVLTSASPDFDLAQALPGIPVVCVPARQTTTFENIYTPNGRQQMLYGRATPLTSQNVPSGWRRPPIVHLAPVADEVDPALAGLFSNSLVGLTPQGWLRTWDESGRVSARSWPAAREVLPLAAAVILSQEDLPDRETLEQFRQWTRLLVLTQGPAGCTVYCQGKVRQIPAPTVVEANPTGAGDIFAAAFLLRLWQTWGNPWEAAAFANRVASSSITQVSLADKFQIIQEVLKE
ncbi:MAG: PfkB family carbohydrate kinase [Chloroflexi bacterium]|nr:PfkB family carbohydrate kinase [Chloroflexota bacterium]MCI0644509.1 PfkB family carbohydrate kinase [Chloroflexota bacterium]MCI0728802.1 PfkB family carbohydrate kinase [Chloroflexota bacterium]